MTAHSENRDDPGRILFSEWADGLAPSAGMSDRRVWAQERDPCPICGHPTGDCTPHTSKENLA